MKPTLAKGTRDFSPLESARRQYIFETIRKVFTLHGYQPLETPAMENLQTLTGKYGDEGDRLIFKILNSGDFLKPLREQNLLPEDSSKVISLVSEKALRYDLTVPFARFVAMNRDKISFPFKRYQIQPVWRADRPQRGRYREFYQCDADVVGSSSLLCETELISIYDQVFATLGLDVNIHINNRKILAGIAEKAGIQEQFTAFTVAIDKLDKIGWDGVQNELNAQGISVEAADLLKALLDKNGSPDDILTHAKTLLSGVDLAMRGILELEAVFYHIRLSQPEGLKAQLLPDFTLARGLNYYTGTILEVKMQNFNMGSIGGGGRYDDLTGIFGFPNVPGVGISFGADRIYDVLLELNKFPEHLGSACKVLFVYFDAESPAYCLPLMAKFRAQGISCEFFPEQAKLQKQFTYADRKGIPYVAIAGENERKENKFSLKNMQSGTQKTLSLEGILQLFSHL
ncbi:MAG: histidine--tRNA ligase [Flavobacteriales bacterium]